MKNIVKVLNYSTLIASILLISTQSFAEKSQVSAAQGVLTRTIGDKISKRFELTLSTQTTENNDSYSINVSKNTVQIILN